MKLTRDILNRLTEFFSSYMKRVDLLKGLSSKHKAPDDIALLACCYLEQLGGCLFSKSGSSKLGFEQILLNHSGERDEFSLISISDLAYDLLRMAEFVYGLIEKPGRVQIFSDDDKPLIRFIDQSGVALSDKAVAKFLISVVSNLKSDFRIHPYQTKNKSSFGDMEVVIDSIMSTPKLKRLAPEIKEVDVKSFIKEYKYTSILYRDYRCKAVHEVAGITVNKKNFWKLKRPYFVEYRPHWLQYDIFHLEFPAFFLIECLETCVECVEKAITGKGLLPLPIWNAICDIDEFDFLDVEQMEEVKPIKLRID